MPCAGNDPKLFLSASPGVEGHRLRECHVLVLFAGNKEGWSDQAIHVVDRPQGLGTKAKMPRHRPQEYRGQE